MIQERCLLAVQLRAACRELCSAWKAAWLACIAISFCAATPVSSLLPVCSAAWFCVQLQATTEAATLQGVAQPCTAPCSDQRDTRLLDLLLQGSLALSGAQAWCCCCSVILHESSNSTGHAPAAPLAVAGPTAQRLAPQGPKHPAAAAALCPGQAACRLHSSHPVQPVTAAVS